MTSHKQGLKGYRKVMLSLIGAVFVIFGALWMTAIFPSLEKIPTDYERTITFDATYMVANPQTQSMDTIPVTLTRQQQATGTEANNVMLIDEVMTVKNAVTGDDLSAMFGTSSVIAIDRSTLAMSPEYGDISRQGQWAPPKQLGEGDSYLLWNPAANRPLQANYVRSENFQGLNVVVFNIDETNLSLGPDPRANNLEQFLTTDITLWIESSSGTVVDQTATTTLSHDIPQMGKVPSFMSTVRYTDATIADMMDTARSARWLLLWFRTLIPWMAIAFGAVLVITPPIVFAIGRSTRKSTADKPTDIPQPTSLHLDV